MRRRLLMRMIARNALVVVHPAINDAGLKTIQRLLPMLPLPVSSLKWKTRRSRLIRVMKIKRLPRKLLVVVVVAPEATRTTTDLLFVL
jgi:hypothetical protein